MNCSADARRIRELNDALRQTLSVSRYGYSQWSSLQSLSLCYNFLHMKKWHVITVTTICILVSSIVAAFYWRESSQSTSSSISGQQTLQEVQIPSSSSTAASPSSSAQCWSLQEKVLYAQKILLEDPHKRDPATTVVAKSHFNTEQQECFVEIIAADASKLVYNYELFDAAENLVAGCLITKTNGNTDAACAYGSSKGYQIISSDQYTALVQQSMIE